MHPAYSVIVFTTASGAGYGLLIWLALSLPGGVPPGKPPAALIALALALALVSAGLLSSTLHLGRPERAWRALSQWRSSWLSREAVAALFTYVPALLLGAAWLGAEGLMALLGALAGLAALGALATVWCTGMIYASLPTVAAWHQRLTAPLYVLLALATGGLLLNLLLHFEGGALPAMLPLSVAGLLVAGAWAKARYWNEADRAGRITTARATGLDRHGVVRVLDPPHSQPNFVMREMGYQVARRHARRLRRLVLLLLFALPAALLLLQLAAGQSALSALCAGFAVLAASVGVLIERWLFFAEAEHVAAAYYRAGSQNRDIGG